MRDTLKLEHPIYVNGAEIKELDYDAQEITALQFSEACSRAAAISKKNTSVNIKFRENDYSLHLYLGIMAIIALNPQIDISDLERIKGFDILKVTDIGMSFTLRIAAGNSKENDSEKQSENTAESTTSQQENYSEND